MSEPIRVGGLISGIDVNGIIKELVDARSGVLDRLKEQKEYLEIERDVYRNISDMVSKLKNTLLNLRLQSTYMKKDVFSSDPSVLTATAGLDAAFGRHRIKVLDIAEPAKAMSLYARAKLVKEGAGVTGGSGRPTETVEGKDVVDVYQDTDTGKYFAVDRFYIGGKNTINALSGSVLESSSVEGTISSDVTAGSAVQFTYGGKSLVAYTGVDYQADTTSLYDVAKDLQNALNTAINEAKGTVDETYILVRVKPQVGTGNDVLVVYDVKGEGVSFGSGSTETALGLDSTTSFTTDHVENAVYADDLDSLKTAINSHLIDGLSFEADSLTTGSFELIRDASLKVEESKPTKILGGEGVSTGGGINLDAVGLQNAGFAKTVTDDINGTFTINGVKITIEDYTSLSVRDVLAMINSSGAGVTAYYDAKNDRFILESNDEGADIKLGSPDDTSNFLTVAKLTALEGAIKEPGSTGGSIDPTVPLAEANLSVVPTSGVFTINGVSIYVDVNKDSLNDLIYKVNSSAAGVKMVYDKALDKIILLSDPEPDGTNAQFIELGSSTDTSNILYAFNLVRSPTAGQYIGSKGKDAVIEVDGVTYVRPTNDIDDVIGGVTLELNGVSDSYVTLDVKPDSDEILDKFAEFIANYNSLIKKLNPPELSDYEKKFLEPLSEEDKASMTDKEIEEYEKKHKEYLSYEIIRNSRELQDFLSRLRDAVFSKVEGLSPYDDITDIGVTTDYFGTFESEVKGYLVTDSTDKDEIKNLLESNDKFMEAINRYPDKVFELMAVDKDGKKGIARKLADVVDGYFGITGMIYSYIKPGGYLDERLRDVSKDILRETSYLAEYEEQLWQKFTLMEETIARLQAQSQYLSMQLSSLMGGGK